ncbi:MAG: methylmalonyl-CoA mutase, partial [Gemmatimonadales bacterium]
SERSCRLRVQPQTGGSTLTAQQPLNNVVRVAVQALAAVLGGTQSLHTNGYDEALNLPTADAARLALRTQQILAEESGATATVDPLGGSYYVESLTSKLEVAAHEYLRQIDELQGASDVIRFMSEEIHEAAYRHQLAVESGECRIVGVNEYLEAEEQPRIETPAFDDLEAAQKQSLAQVRARRDDAVVERCLAQVTAAASSEHNLLPPMIEAVRARATVGEISGVLTECWGRYQPA